MVNADKVIDGGGRDAEIVEVATTQISEHSKQGEYSPAMSKKKWGEFVANIARDGIMKPIVVTKGFRVVDGEYHYRAAKELGIESMRVVIEDIPENEIAAYMTNTKLQQAELKNGQKAALVIRLHYEEERQKASGRQATSTGGINPQLIPKLDEADNKTTNEILAKKAGIGKSSMAYLIAVYRNRPDLFELVFDGTYSINRAYTQMKADEEPEVAEEESDFNVNAAEIIEKAIEEDKRNPQIIESESLISLDNRLIQMRKKALALRVEVVDECRQMDDARDDVRESAKAQLLALAKTCVISLGASSSDEDEQGLYIIINELLEKIGGDV